MKKKFSKLLALLLSLMILASQVMLPAFAVDTSNNCSCDPATREGTLVSSIPATCVSYGVDIYQCDECNKQWSKYTGSPSGAHTLETANAKAPTCTEIGWETYEYCTVCSYTEYVEIPALGHKTIVESPKDPTCTEMGHTGREYCWVCKKYVKYAEIIPANGHKAVVDKAVAPTCTETGLTEGTHCSVCEEVIIAQEIIDATGHNGLPTEGVVSETCTEGAYTVYECQTCKEHYKVYDANRPAKGHTEAAVVPENVVPPTCEAEGSHEDVVYCKDCNIELSRTFVVDAALGHDYVAGTPVAPTCSVQGYTTYTCSQCNDSYNDDYTAIDTTKHTPVVTKPFIAATCSAEGQHAEVTCSSCGLVLVNSTVIPVNPDAHKEKVAVKENTVDPDCTNKGSYDSVVYCEYCDIELSRVTNPIDALGHKEVVDDKVDATCTETGLTEGKHCSVCKEVLVPQQIIDALGHTPDVVKVEKEVAPTCTVDGSYDNVVYCTTCGVELSRETVIVPATKHDYGTSPVEVVEATCTEKAYEKYVCKVCDYEYIHYTAEALGHIEVVDAAVDATCTEAGLTEGKHCSRCEEVLVAQEEIKAFGHDVEVFEAVAATCTTPGHTGYEICKTCGEYTKFASRIPALGHTEEIIPGYAATYDACGLTDGKKCSVCEEELYPQKVIPNLNEDVKLSYKVTGINGADVAVNSGYVTFDIYMDANYARLLYAFNFEFNFDAALKLVNVKNGEAFALLDSNLINDTTLKLMPSMGVTYEGKDFINVKEVLVATLTFKVDADFVGIAQINTASVTVTRDDEVFAYDVVVDCQEEASIEVVMLGNVNSSVDDIIDAKDVLAFAKWSANADENDYEAVLDMNKDGIIDGKDFALIRGAAVGNTNYLD